MFHDREIKKESRRSRKPDFRQIHSQDRAGNFIWIFDTLLPMLAPWQNFIYQFLNTKT